MRLVLWQNCLSPHQLPYIVELINDIRVDTVDLIVGETISRDRVAMGWQLPQINDKKDSPPEFNVYIQPKEYEIESLLCKRVQESIHLFVGIRGFAYVFKAFCTSLKYKVKRGIITERPNTYAFGLANGKPLWLHKIRFLLQDKKYIPYIHYIFAIGEECADYYRSISTSWKIVPFAYCTANSTISPSETKDEIKVMYIGALAWWKSVSSLLYANKGYDISIDLVGDGPERKKLELIVSKLHLENVHFLGVQKNCDIPNVMAAHDVLVLPSVYDGWGAVVNEALMNGVFVICSDKCGAKELINDFRLGMIFNAGNVKDLANCLSYIKNNIDLIRLNRNNRKLWAQSHICGKVIATYMVDVLSGIDRDSPWAPNN